MPTLDTFEARTDTLADVVGLVARRCRELEVSHTASLRLQLIAEELFLNTVQHGYGGRCAERVGVSVRREGAEVRLLFEDRAPPFNPVGGALPVPATGVLEDHPAGGFGCRLIMGLASGTCYERTAECNRTEVRLRIE